MALVSGLGTVISLILQRRLSKLLENAWVERAKLETGPGIWVMTEPRCFSQSPPIQVWTPDTAALSVFSSSQVLFIMNLILTDHSPNSINVDFLGDLT